MIRISILATLIFAMLSSVGCNRLSNEPDPVSDDFKAVYKALKNSSSVSVISVSEARNLGPSKQKGYGVSAFWNEVEQPIEFVALFYKTSADIWKVGSIGFEDFESLKQTDKEALKEYLDNVLRQLNDNRKLK